MPAPGKFETAFRELTPLLMEQGWLLPPRMLGGELDELWNRCEPLRATPPLAGKKRRDVEQAINSILVFYAKPASTPRS